MSSFPSMTAPGDFLTVSGSYLQGVHVGTESQSDTQEYIAEVSTRKVRCFIGEASIEVAKGATEARVGATVTSGVDVVEGGMEKGYCEENGFSKVETDGRVERYGEVECFSKLGTGRVSTGSCTQSVLKILDGLFSKVETARVSSGSSGKFSKFSKIILEFISKEGTVRLPSGSCIKEVGKLVENYFSNAEAARAPAGPWGNISTVRKIILEYLSMEGICHIPSGSAFKLKSVKRSLPSSPSARKRLRT